MKNWTFISSLLIVLLLSTSVVLSTQLLSSKRLLKESYQQISLKDSTLTLNLNKNQEMQATIQALQVSQSLLENQQSEELDQLRQELKNRGIQIKNLKAQVKLNPNFEGQIITIRDTLNEIDTLYLSPLANDTNLKFWPVDDGYLKGTVFVAGDSMAFPYKFNTGDIYVDIHRNETDGFFKTIFNPGPTEVTVSFSNPNATSSTVRAIVKDEQKPKWVLSVGAGYGIQWPLGRAAGGSVYHGPSFGIQLGFPVATFY